MTQAAAPPDNRRNRRWITIVAVIVLLAASLVPILAASKLATPIDDAYITFVYARSLAQGYGFRAFPTAPPTLGTTTPLLTFILAALYRLLPGVEMKDLAVGLSVAAWIGTAWLWAWRGKSLGLTGIERFCIAVLVLVETELRIVNLGMEFWLFSFLLTLCVIVYFERRMFLAGIISGLLFLTRGEGVLILGAFVVYQALASGLRPRKLWIAVKEFLPVVAGFVVVVAVWALYALPTFGQILPSTLSAKMVQLSLGFVEPFFQYTFKVLTHYWDNLGLVSIGFTTVSVWVILAVLGIAYAVTSRRRLLVLLTWAAAFAVGYTVLGAPGYAWYPLPLMYVLTVFAGLAPAALVGLLPRRQERIGRVVALAGVALICVVIIPKNIPAQPIVDGRNADYKRMAGWLNANTPVGSRAAFLEVGMLQWYSQREIVDLLGLTTPQELPALLKGGYPLAFQVGDVDYLIFMEPFAWGLDPILASPYFSARYEPVARLSGTRFAGYPFIVYQRGAAPPAIPPQGAADVNFDFNLATTTHDLSDIHPTSDGAIQATAGPEPYFAWDGLKLCAADYRQVVVQVAASENVPGRVFRIYYTRDGSFTVPDSGKLPILADAGLHTYVLNTSLLEDWGGVLTGIRLDPITGVTTAGHNIVTVKSLRLVRGDGPSQCHQEALTTIF